jgi:NAD(P)-dependent dehydrogenase (short-subunit alcohol dehydrogenase family)
VRERIEDAGGHAASFRCDVSQPSDVRSAIEQVAVTHGTLDVLVNSGRYRNDSGGCRHQRGRV